MNAISTNEKPIKTPAISLVTSTVSAKNASEITKVSALISNSLQTFLKLSTVENRTLFLPWTRYADTSETPPKIMSDKTEVM